jgi:site-specific DNA recombinase
MNLRAGAYCRVSTDKEDQLNSLRSQKSYFQDYIESHEGWTLADIYADEGISGTSVRKREAFGRMIRDAELGRLDLILTKEVSRFARNTVDTLAYTRKLKQWGVGVIFISDSIDTRDNDGELRLTIMASIAQEESRKTSQRVKWGQKRRMEQGVVFGNHSAYGFTISDGKISINEAEAVVIRKVFYKFLTEGKGAYVIARELGEEGIAPPKRTDGAWSGVMVRRILRNEKVAGDLLQKKYITTDYLTHKKEENRGREEQVYLRDHHEAIISRQLWVETQGELERRNKANKQKTRYSSRYWCSGKLRCGSCGSCFVLRKTRRPNGDCYMIWGCRNRVQYGTKKENGQSRAVGCDMKMLNEKVLTACVQYVLSKLPLNWDVIAEELIAQIQNVRAETLPDWDIRGLPEKRAELERKIVRVMDAYFGERISIEEMTTMKERYRTQIEMLDARISSAAEAQRNRRELSGEEELKPVLRESMQNSERVFEEMIEKVTVFGDHLAIQVRGMPKEVLLRYTAKGRREGYTVTIEEYETVERRE